MSIIAIEAKRSLGRFGGMLIAILVIVTTASLHFPGVWEWSSTTQGLCASAVVVVPFTVAFANLQAGLRYRYSTRLRLRQTVRSAARVLLPHYCVTVGWLIVGYIVGCAGYGVLGLLAGIVGSPLWLWLVTTGAGVAFAGTIGYAVGAIAGFRWYLPPLLGMSTYLGFIPVQSLATGDAYWTSHLYPITDDQFDMFSGLNTLTLGGQLAWYVGASVLVVAVCVIGLRRLTGLAAVTAAMAVLVAVGGASQVARGHGHIDAGYVSWPQKCERSDQLEVCVASPYKSALPALTKSFNELRSKLRFTSWVPRRLSQSYLDDVDHVQPGWRSIYLRGLPPGFAAEAVADYLQQRVVSGTCFGNADWSFALQVPLDWLERSPNSFASLGNTSDVSRAAQRFWRLSELEKAREVGRLEPMIDQCTLRPDDVAAEK